MEGNCDLGELRSSSIGRLRGDGHGSQARVSLARMGRRLKARMVLRFGFRGRAFEIFDNFLQIFPGLAFLGWVAQKIRGVKCWHDFDAAKIPKLATHAADAFAYFQEIS